MPRPEEPAVRIIAGILRLSDGGTARVRLSCPRETRIGCEGEIDGRLIGRRGVDEPTRLGREAAPYELRRGESERVEIDFSRQERRKIGRRPIALQLIAIEEGREGPKTVSRIVGVCE